MKRLEPNAPEMQSADVVADNIAHLKTLFPEAFAAEGKIDFDVLKQLLGGEVDDREERYGLNWHGKRKARQLALTPSTGTLRPCPEESVAWDTTQNIFIEGDNLEVLKLLQKSYAGKVKLIYIDPPYNTGNDFVYPDDFTNPVQRYFELTGQVEGGVKISSNPEASGRFHTDWLNMMLPRLKVAQSLLHDDGVIFISIDDVETANLRVLCDEVFGAENFVATLIWQKVFAPKNTARHFSEDHDYVVCYTKRKDDWLPQLLPRSDEAIARYTNSDNDPRGPWTSGDMTARNYYSEGQYTVKGPTGKTFAPAKGMYWRVNAARFRELDAEKRVWWGDSGSNMPRLKRFISEVKDGVVPQTLLLHTLVGNTQEAKKELVEFADFEETENVLNSVKPTRLIRHLLKIGTQPKATDIVLDFFAGSGSTAHSVLRQNHEDGGDRRFIAVQIPEPLPKEENACKTLSDITKSRLRNAIARDDQCGGSSKSLGFRVFKLDSGNLEPWDPATKDVPSAIAKAVDNIKADRTDDDLVYDVLLKTGLDLCVPIESKKIAGKEVKSIGGGVLFTCFATKIKAADAEPLALGIVKWRDELAPANPKECRVVFRDSAFESDVAKSNLAAILKQHGFDEKLIASL